MTAKCEIGMSLENKKHSRVHQLRDLFQIGKPIPAEELEELEYSRPRSRTDPHEREQTSAFLENSASMKSSNSNLSIDSIPQKPKDIVTGSEMKRNPWIVRKTRPTSESDLSNFDKTDNSSDQMKDGVTASPTSRKNPYEFNISIMCPIVPFVGNQSPKIRSLGKEFEARRLSKTLPDESIVKTGDSLSNNISVKYPPQPPSLSPSPSSPTKPNHQNDAKSNSHPISNNSPSSDDYFDPISNLDNGELDQKNFNDTDSDSDVDKSKQIRIITPKSYNLEEESFEDLIEGYKAELMKIDQLDIENVVLDFCSGGIDESDKNLLLDVHSKYRLIVSLGYYSGQPPATNMQQMAWNAESASKAQIYADKCIFAHDTLDNRKYGDFEWVGQNVAKFAGEIITRGVELWYNEASGFTFENSACSLKTCGHYTQLVWANSTEVGCGLSKCSIDGIDLNLLVCNYGPGGNYVGEKPYKAGKTCSECKSGQSCTEYGLCN